MQLREQYSDTELDLLRGQILYHLGRVLYKDEPNPDFDRAVAVLREARQLMPDDLRVTFYLAQAIRAQVERNQLALATELLREYLLKGAPLGHENEVREFLGTRTK